VHAGLAYDTSVDLAQGTGFCKPLGRPSLMSDNDGKFIWFFKFI
jgi:hypothetical protein